MNNGVVVIESFDEEQQLKLKQAIETNDKIEVKITKNQNPMFIVTGILKGYSDEEFIEELERSKYEILDDLGVNIKDKIKVVTKRQCRNELKRNWILKAHSNITKWFLKKGTVFFDLMSVNVVEYFNLAICFKCSGFGHVAKYCRQESCCCHKCGGAHEAKACNEEKYKCPNCTKMKLPELEHSARDQQCPVYKRRLENYKSSINYNTFL